MFFFISFKVKERDAILPEELLKMRILNDCVFIYL